MSHQTSGTVRKQRCRWFGHPACPRLALCCQHTSACDRAPLGSRQVQLEVREAEGGQGAPASHLVRLPLCTLSGGRVRPVPADPLTAFLVKLGAGLRLGPWPRSYASLLRGRKWVPALEHCPSFATARWMLLSFPVGRWLPGFEEAHSSQEGP